MTLHDKLVRRILNTGPISVAEFMNECLHDKEHGYYAVRPRLGEEGDFVTAPLVSQMFGELIGLWAVETWSRLGEPKPFRLIELGPGDGTLMKDVLRAANVKPGFRSAADLWLVEASAPLRKIQAEALAHEAPNWSADLDGTPRGAPTILIANEFLDCLPVRQFVRTDKGWAERVVGVVGGKLAFGLAGASDPLLGRRRSQNRIGELVEISPQQQSLARSTAERIAEDGGCALFIDYGSSQQTSGDTLQALQRHRKVDPLSSAGAADLTVHADFPGFVEAAASPGIEVTDVLTQGAFLLRLGLETRAAALAQARPDLEALIRRQALRLAAPEEMGQLFKVLAIHQTGLEPPGFEREAATVETPKERQGDLMTAHPPLEPLRSLALQTLEGVRHGFFTREGGVSRGIYASLNLGAGSKDDAEAVMENRRRAAEALGVEAAHLLVCHQIHSATAVFAHGPFEGPRPQADAVVTVTKGVACGALSADCAPVLLADNEARVVAAAHAGWRGALGGVVEAAVAAMHARGADPKRIVAVVGPCIGPASYEVGVDFLDRFQADDPGSETFFSPAVRPGKRMFDLPAYVLHRLRRAGVESAEWIGRDTYSDPTLFYSHRRAVHRGEADYGRLLSAITLE